MARLLFPTLFLLFCVACSGVVRGDRDGCDDGTLEGIEDGTADGASCQPFDDVRALWLRNLFRSGRYSEAYSRAHATCYSVAYTERYEESFDFDLCDSGM